MYLGTGKLEHELLQAIESNIKQNSNLQVNILLDKCRALRGHPGNSSVSKIEGLLHKYPRKYHLYILSINLLFI